MTDANTGQTVECPICETPFDPTVAGGWCTNTDCGEWQYTDDEEGKPVDESASTDDVADDSADVSDDAAESDVEPDESADVPDSTAVEADDGSETETETAETDDVSTVDEAEAGTEADESAEADNEQTEVDDDQPSTIDCPDCGSTLDADVNFCPDCGADVQDIDANGPLTACPSCDNEVGPEDNFCVNCGENLEPHRNGGAETHDDADDSADVEPSDDAEAEDAVDALESAEPVPESLVLELDGREIAVADGDTVGREIRAALTDAGRPEDEAVRIHREHVRFVREDDSFYLLDLGDNPTALNGTTLQKGDREPVGPGDEIELSGVATVTVLAP